MIHPAYSDPQLLEWTLDLSKQFNLKTFCETGTYHGGTAQIVSQYFDKIITIENNIDFYNIAKNALQNTKNCDVYLGNSPEVMEQCLEKNDSSIFFFLDAHWEHYWPLLDELKVIKEKNLKPVIAIHDFYVPDENGNAKFGFDHYHGQPLNFDYIKSSVESIYGENYNIKYTTSATVNSGVIYIFPFK